MGADADASAHGEPMPWPQGVARLTLDLHRSAARVLEEAAAELGDAARLQAYASDELTTLEISPREADAAPVAVLFHPHDPTLFVGVDEAWMTWDDAPGPDEALDALRAQVAAVVRGDVTVRRCLANGRWRMGFDLYETREGKEVRRYSNRYVGDLWWWGRRVRTRYAPYLRRA